MELILQVYYIQYLTIENTLQRHDTSLLGNCYKGSWHPNSLWRSQFWIRTQNTLVGKTFKIYSPNSRKFCTTKCPTSWYISFLPSNFLSSTLQVHAVWCTLIGCFQAYATKLREQDENECLPYDTCVSNMPAYPGRSTCTQRNIVHRVQPGGRGSGWLQCLEWDPPTWPGGGQKCVSNTTSHCTNRHLPTCTRNNISKTTLNSMSARNLLMVWLTDWLLDCL